MKYTIEEIINQRIGLKPMTEEQFNKLYKVLKDKYPYRIDNNWFGYNFGAYYRLFESEEDDTFNSKSSSYVDEEDWNCTKEIDFEQINFEDMKYTLKQIVEDRVSIKGLTQDQYEKIIEELNKMYPGRYRKIVTSFDSSSANKCYRFYKDLESNQDFQGTITDTYLGQFHNIESSAEITFEEIDFGSEDFLIERKGRTPANDPDWKEFIDWMNNNLNPKGYGGTAHDIYGLVCGRSNSYRISDPAPSGIPIITLEEWKKRYKMEDKKIIGYKCPMDLFKGSLKIGDIAYTKDKGSYIYAVDGYSLPIEIVESWEPVYEPEEEVINMGEFSITIKDGKASSGLEDITDVLKRAVVHFEACNYVFGEYTVNIDLDSLKFTKTGCKNTTTTYNQWLEIYKKLK